MIVTRIGLAALLSCLSVIAAAAQGAPQPVIWSIAAPAGVSTKPGSHLTLDLTAHIDEGWHVYGFNQAEGGPMPLRITATPNGTLQLAGTPNGTPPVKKHDSSFDLDTEIFSNLVTLHVPVLVKPSGAGTPEDILLDVRYQACNDHICLPPRTIHLTIPARVSADHR